MNPGKALAPLWPGLLLALCLFPGQLLRLEGWTGTVARELQAVFQDPDTQWLVAACLAVYHVFFRWLARGPSSRARWNLADTGLFVLLAVAAVRYAVNYRAGGQSVDALLLFAGATLHAAARWWARPGGDANVPGAEGRLRLPLGSTVLLLAAASWWPLSPTAAFSYHDQPRWSGPWDNPNVAGLLMGAGLVAAAGLAVARARANLGSAANAVTARNLLAPLRYIAGLAGRAWNSPLLWVLAGACLAWGLLRTYSRGAWLGTAAGLAWLCAHRFRDALRSTRQPRPPNATKTAAKRLWAPLSVGAVALALILCWNLREASWLPIQRVASVVNPNDFSWRNRLAAWEGALQMIADSPLTGHGWQRPEELYDNYYRPAHVAEGLAIQLNDYLTLGAALGLPALLGFIAFGACLVRGGPPPPSSPPGKSSTASPPSRMLPLLMSARAAALVLLIGFWFDGGLFKLPVATVFWLLAGAGGCGEGLVRGARS